MSTVLTGNPANVTTPLSVTVTALADNGSGKIRVTTSSPHHFGSSDTVLTVAGSTDVLDTILVIDSTHYDYPTHAFHGNDSGRAVDLSLTPQVLVPTDGDALSAQLSGLLSSMQAVLDRTQYLNKQIVAQSQAPTPGFLPYYGTSDIGVNLLASFQCVAFDPITLKWLLGGQDGSSFDWAIIGRGDKLGWTKAVSTHVTAAAGTVTSICRGIEPSVSDKYIYLSIIQSGALEVARGDTTGSAWSGTLPAGGSTDFLNASILSTNGVVVVAAGATSSTDSNIYFTSNSGGSWAHQTAALLTSPIPSGWILRQSQPGGGQILAIPKVSVGFSYLSSVDGTTWVSQPGLSGLTSPGEVPTDMCYTADQAGVGCWLLVTDLSGVSLTYRSYDGVTWLPLANNLGLAGIVIFSVASYGNGKYTVAAEATTPINRMLFSLDGGGHWSRYDSSMISSVGVLLAGGYSQSLAMSTTYVMPSLSFGDTGGVGSL